MGDIIAVIKQSFFLVHLNPHDFWLSIQIEWAS